MTLRNMFSVVALCLLSLSMEVILMSIRLGNYDHPCPGSAFSTTDDDSISIGVKNRL